MWFNVETRIRSSLRARPAEGRASPEDDEQLAPMIEDAYFIAESLQE